MRTFMWIIKALADEQRVRALMALRGRQLCVCQIIELLELAPSTVSKHMSILRQARLVEARKAGRWVHYRLAGKDAPAEARRVIRWVSRSLANDPGILRDARRLAKLRAGAPKAACP